MTTEINSTSPAAEVIEKKKRGRPKRIAVEINQEVKEVAPVSPPVKNINIKSIDAIGLALKPPVKPKMKAKKENVVYLFKRSTGKNIQLLIGDYLDGDNKLSRNDEEKCKTKISEFYNKLINDLKTDIETIISDDEARFIHVLIELCEDGLKENNLDKGITPILIFYYICKIPGLTISMDYTGVTKIKGSDAVPKISLVGLKNMYLAIHEDPAFCKHIMLDLFGLH